MAEFPAFLELNKLSQKEKIPVSYLTGMENRNCRSHAGADQGLQ